MKKKKRKIKAARKSKKVLRFPHKSKKRRAKKSRRMVSSVDRWAKARGDVPAKKRRKKKARKVSKKKRATAPPPKRTKTKTKSKGRKMAKRKRSKKSKNGIFGSQRGAASLPPKKMIMRVLQKLAHGAEGVTAAKITAAIISKLPVSNPKIKAGIQIGAGLAGSFFTDSKPWLKGLSDGPFYIGSAALARAFGVETMAGEEDYHLAVDSTGNVREMTGDELEELQGNFSGDGDFAMKGNFDGDDGDDMDGDFSLG